MKDHYGYLQRRLHAEEELARSSKGPIRDVHEQFVAAYRQRLAQIEAAKLTVDQLLG